jgi:ribosomal-protein-alanine N-acetyltransferase
MAEVNIGDAFEESRWRKGYGFESVLAVLDFGFRHLKLPEIVAVIVPMNQASRGLAEKCGLRFWKSFKWKNRDRVAYMIKQQGG